MRNIKERLNDNGLRLKKRKSGIGIGWYTADLCGQVYEGRTKGKPSEHVSKGLLLGRGNKVGFIPVLRF